MVLTNTMVKYLLVQNRLGVEVRKLYYRDLLQSKAGPLHTTAFHKPNVYSIICIHLCVAAHSIHGTASIWLAFPLNRFFAYNVVC